jgi:hypothetical protein
VSASCAPESLTPFARGRGAHVRRAEQRGAGVAAGHGHDARKHQVLDERAANHDLDREEDASLDQRDNLQSYVATDLGIFDGTSGFDQAVERINFSGGAVDVDECDWSASLVLDLCAVL